MKRLFVVVAMACTPHTDTAAVDAGPNDVGLDALVDAADAGTEEPWQDAMREDRWEDALRLLGPAKETESPEVRFARARAAVETGNADEALSSLDKIGTALPLLSQEASRLRARAQAIKGPFEDAGDWFASQPLAADQLRAARAFESAKSWGKARAAAGRVLAAKHSRREEAEARAIRMRGEGESEADAKDDGRWLFVHAADLAFGDDARHTKPTRAELQERAETLADAGRGDDALTAFEQGQRIGAPAPIAEHRRRRADLLMRARAHYADAAKAYFEAYVASHAPSDLLSSARALSRDNQDDLAIDRYDDVGKTFPKAHEAGDAAFLAARLVFLHGRWADAVKRLDEYARRFPQGDDRKEANRLRGIAHLRNGDAKGARKILEDAAGGEGDAVASGRMSVLAAAAAFADGDKTHAIARWTDIARTLPLTWPALVARARLASVGAPLPPLLDPAGPSGAAPLAAPALPAPVGTLHDLGLDGDAERALRIREGVVMAGAPTRTDEALCRAYGTLERAERRFQLSSSVPKALLERAPDASSRWAWECAYPAPFSKLVARLEGERKLPAGLVHAVMRQESGFDVDIVSPARAVGLMQLMPETATATGLEIGMVPTPEDLVVPAKSITLGARYLRDVLDRVHAVPLAAAAYNAGPEAIERWSKGMDLDVDAFVEAIPYIETRGYVAKVMGNLARYGYLAGGEDGVPKVELALHVP